MGNGDRQVTPERDERDAMYLPGEGGAVIPVPEKDDFFANLRKVAKADDDSDDADE